MIFRLKDLKGADPHLFIEGDGFFHASYHEAHMAKRREIYQAFQELYLLFCRCYHLPDLGQDDGEDQEKAFNDELGVGGDVHKVEDVRDDSQDQDAEDRPDDPATTSVECGSSHHDGGDGI